MVEEKSLLYPKSFVSNHYQRTVAVLRNKGYVGPAQIPCKFFLDNNVMP
jgi:hypothetical protein